MRLNMNPAWLLFALCILYSSLVKCSTVQTTTLQPTTQNVTELPTSTPNPWCISCNASKHCPHRYFCSEGECICQSDLSLGCDSGLQCQTEHCKVNSDCVQNAFCSFGCECKFGYVKKRSGQKYICEKLICHSNEDCLREFPNSECARTSDSSARPCVCDSKSVFNAKQQYCGRPIVILPWFIFPSTALIAIVTVCIMLCVCCGYCIRSCFQIRYQDQQGVGEQEGAPRRLSLRRISIPANIVLGIANLRRQSKAALPNYDECQLYVGVKPKLAKVPEQHSEPEPDTVSLPPSYETVAKNPN